MITHRCEGNRKAFCPIRYGKRYYWEDDAPDLWILYSMEYDYEGCNPFKPYMNAVAEIKYCPFCGEKLEVEK